MTTRRRARTRALRSLAAATAAAGLCAATAGCSGENPVTTVTRAAGTVADTAAKAAEALGEARREFDDIKDGIDARGHIAVRGAVGFDAARHAVVHLTAANTADANRTFTVQVEFRGRTGQLLDTVVVTVPSVVPGGIGTATARSNTPLTSPVWAVIPRAVRH